DDSRSLARASRLVKPSLHPSRSTPSTPRDGGAVRRSRGAHVSHAEPRLNWRDLSSAQVRAIMASPLLWSETEDVMRNTQRGVTLVEVVVVLLVVGILMGSAVPTVGAALDGFRATGAAADLYAAVHLTKTRARATGVTHALVLEPDGRGFRIVADPSGAAETVEGPHPLVDGAAATNTIPTHFSSTPSAL